MGERRRRIEMLAMIARRKGPGKLAGVLSRKSRNQVYPRLPVDLDRLYRRKVPADFQIDAAAAAADSGRLRAALDAEERARYRRSAAAFARGRVTFLNRSRSVADPSTVTPTDERITDLPRLWYLKLASLEPLRWAVLGHERAADADAIVRVGTRWLEAVADREPIAGRVGYLRGFWTPYAVSRRVVTLCRYAAWNEGLSTPVERFLFKNLLFLANNVERDVGGNHLFENGAALVVGGVTVPGHGERFLETGLSVLEAASAKQILDDGYHYERSPMYHLAVTERLLTAQSVLRESGRHVPGWLHDATERACGFAEHLRPPDDRIPLLNDAVFDEAERLDTVTGYGRALDVKPDVPAVPGDSQLHWLGGDDLAVLFDAGDSGPEHQLGHVHNDPCTILAWRDGRRVVVDTGTFDYQPGERRQLARGVRAHNTVAVDGTEPVAIGGRFRTGTALRTTTERSTDGDVTAVTAAYAAGDERSYRHRRTCYEGSGWVFVRDVVNSDAEGHVSRLHAHPAVTIEENGSKFRFVHEGGPCLHVHPVDVASTSVHSAPYFPRFGEGVERSVLTLQADAGASAYLLASEAGSVRLDAVDDDRTTLHVAGEQYELPEAGR